jgi:hypothetical protein
MVVDGKKASDGIGMVMPSDELFEACHGPIGNHIERDIALASRFVCSRVRLYGMARTVRVTTYMHTIPGFSAGIVCRFNSFISR